MKRNDLLHSTCVWSTWLLLLSALLAGNIRMQAQRILTLDSCLNMALDNNKQLGAAKMKQEMSRNLRKSARTKYLPQVNMVGGYVFSSREISILSDEQKQHFANLGSNMQQYMNSMGASIGGLEAILNAEGAGIVNGFHTNTRHLFAGSVVATMPLYMGGSITALNRMADIGEEMAENSTEAVRQNTLYDTEQAYWTVVSLRNKQRLAESYLALVKRLNGDVQKMIAEGVATRSEGLSVEVKQNEAEMTLLQVNDGLTLARMMLCQLCGMPANENILLEDEKGGNTTVELPTDLGDDSEEGTDNMKRPELRMLQNTIDMSRQTTRLAKSGYLPKITLMGSYSVTNPNVYNGFQREFAGIWNIGVLVSVPVLNWGDVTYKVRASKNATAMAQMELNDAHEKVNLQVSQCTFKVNEAAKKLALVETSCKRAEENLRCANIGFREGVLQSTTVMEAQTAWLQAHTQKIDTEIEMLLSRSNLKKAKGILQ
ncbi:MAG: TolC family protein [Prevotella sp.]